MEKKYTSILNSLDNVLTEVMGAVNKADQNKPSKWFSPFKYRNYMLIRQTAYLAAYEAQQWLYDHRESDHILTNQEKQLTFDQVIVFIINTYEIFEDLFYLAYQDDYTVATIMDNAFTGWSISKT